MKQLTTKSIGSLLIAMATGMGNMGKRAKEKQLERILQRHDRKGELRASILGISAPEYRSLHRKLAFDRILRMHGFADREAFWLALTGKLRDELLHRGWSRQKIDQLMHQGLVAAV